MQSYWESRIADAKHRGRVRRRRELVTRAMMPFVAPTVTPISRVLSQREGELLGTGSYVGDAGERS